MTGYDVPFKGPETCQTSKRNPIVDVSEMCKLPREHVKAEKDHLEATECHVLKKLFC
jgi:hypothetical protein